MRLIAMPIAALCLFAAACERAPEQPATSATPAPSTAVAQAALAKPDVFPQWLQVANQAGGGAVYYHPASIVRLPDASAAEVWVEVLFGTDQTYVTEDKTTRQTITYTRERFLFRFDCNRTKYVIVERRIMGAGETIAETIKTPAEAQNAWMDVNPGGVTAVTLGPACKADIKAP